ncbi:MAG: hypothetical protein ABSD46_02265 [Bacteroidota bacterium]
MNTNSKLNEPFAFWLAQKYLPREEKEQMDVEPLNNRTIVLIAIGILTILSVIRFMV